MAYREPGVRHWDVLWDRRPADDGAPTWHKYLTGCRSLAEARLFVALFARNLAAREWLPVRNGVDPRLLAGAARARGGPSRLDVAPGPGRGHGGPLREHPRPL